MIRKIVSGGQTGADCAALRLAISLGISHGGWCPRGRRREDGLIPKRFRLRETPSRAYLQRTRWNVRDADGTVIFSIAGPRRSQEPAVSRFVTRVLREVLTPRGPKAGRNGSYAADRRKRKRLRSGARDRA